MQNKNFFAAYVANPELIWGFLSLILFFALALPRWLIYRTNLKKNELEIWLSNDKALPIQGGRDDSCSFCGGTRKVKELIGEVPYKVSYRLFFPEENGSVSYYQIRCATCSSQMKKIKE